jgi:ABC-2 type transport system ATP-binding protein
MNNVLEVRDLTKQFATGPWYYPYKHNVTAVNGISFSVGKGEILGFLGANGSGKTTTIQMLLGTMIPTSGSISYFGKDFVQHRSASLQRVTFASAYAKLLGRLTILENLTFFGRLYGLTDLEIAERSEELLKYFAMWEIRHQKAGGLSAGQTTRVMLVKAFLPRPAIVLLDEPTASLDPDIALEVRKFILQQQRDAGISVLFTSHNMEEVAEICDRILVLRSGEIIANDTPENLARSIAMARVTLIADDLQAIEQAAQQQGLVATIQGHLIHVQVDEQQIALFLQRLAAASVTYTNISIDKPSLEDYFLHITRSQR